MSHSEICFFLSSPLPLPSSPRRRGPSIVGRVPKKPDNEFNVGQDPCPKGRLRCDPDILSRRGGFNLLFLIPFIFLFLIGCHSDPISTSGESQPTIVGGTITSDTTWRAENGPYHVIEDLYIPFGLNWTVEAGTEFVVDWNKAIRIQGIAYFRLAYPDSITVTSSNGVWRGFKFYEPSLYSQSLNRVVISNAVIGALCTDGADVSFSFSRFLTCDSICVLAGNRTAVHIIGCDFINDRTLNLLRPIAVRTNNCNSLGVSSSLIKGFYCGVQIENIMKPSIWYNTIENCDIGIMYDCQDSALCEFNAIEHNDFRNCQTGILITQGSPLITYNTFEKQGKCIEVKEYCRPEAHYNSFVGTDRLAWVHHSSYDVDATYNWWGTTDPDSIDRLIYDHNDNPDYGTVHYEPFLTTAP